MRAQDLESGQPLNQSGGAPGYGTAENSDSSTNANQPRSASFVRSLGNCAWRLTKTVTVGGDLFPSLWRNSRDAFCKTGDERNCKPLTGRIVLLMLYGSGESLIVYLSATAVISSLPASIALWTAASTVTAIFDTCITGIEEPGVSPCGDDCLDSFQTDGSFSR